MCPGGVKMRTLIRGGMMVAALCTMPVQAATLIGDNVTIRTLVGTNPNINTYPVTVVDVSAEVDLNSYGNQNIESDYIYADWDNPGFASIGFDSRRTDIEYLDLDWTDAPGILTGVTLTTNILGLDDTRISFGDDFIKVDLKGLGVDGGQSSRPFSYYQLDLQVSQVPLPPAAILFFTGLAGLAGAGIRKKVA